MGAATGAEWTAYNARFNTWDSKYKSWKKQDTEYANDNAKAKGIFSLALAIGIWDQVKEKTANEIWEWLKTNYGKEAFIEVLEDFRYIRDLKIDLSDPNPQLANFMHHYQRLPMQAATNPQGTISTAKARAVSESMACLILLSNLPLATANIGQTSIYQAMIEDYTRQNVVNSFKLSDVTEQIRTTWAARFGSLPTREQPKKGTFYVSDPKGKGPAVPKPPQAQRNTSIKDKGPAPRFSDQHVGNPWEAWSDDRLITVSFHMIRDSPRPWSCSVLIRDDSADQLTIDHDDMVLLEMCHPMSFK